MNQKKPQFEPGYPKTKYRPSEEACGYESKSVHSSDHEEKLGEGWHDSPADFGVETCPGREPDPEIAKNRDQFLASVQASRKVGRSKKAHAEGGDAA